MLLLLSADFFQNQFYQKILPGTLSVSNCLDPDQDRHFVGPDLDPNCLQTLSADDKDMESFTSNQDKFVEFISPIKGSYPKRYFDNNSLAPISCSGGSRGGLGGGQFLKKSGKIDNQVKLTN